jgi:hypothetical protein
MAFNIPFAVQFMKLWFDLFIVDVHLFVRNHVSVKCHDTVLYTTVDCKVFFFKYNI